MQLIPLDDDAKVLINFLNRTFFSGFRHPEKMPNYSTIELIIDPYCNLACKYCYLNKYGRELNPNISISSIRENSKKIIDFLKDLGFKGRIEIFGGEPLIKDYALDMIEQFLIETDAKEIVVPSNMTFLLNIQKDKRVRELIELGKDLGRPFLISSSWDGKLMQAINRPFKVKKSVDFDAWADKIFEFATQYKIGFHPMIYSNNIEQWFDNFLWFQKKFKEFNIPFSSLYLLEVRNPEWTIEQIKSFMSFIDNVVKWTFNTPCKSQKKNFLEFLFEKRGYNLLSAPFSTIGRGIGCSIQSALHIRINDLAIVPCHRTSYEHFIAGYLKFDGKNVYVKSKNIVPYLAIHALSAKTLPMCEHCPLNSMCSFGCLGAQYETTGDLFTPIPTVCMLEHGKVFQLIRSFQDVDVLNDIKARVSPEKKSAIEFLEGIL